MQARHTLAVIFACAAIGALSVRSARADSAPDETLTVEGLSRPTDILIDKGGVPHIFAQNEHDAFFVQGFNAARDRMFQIDLWRRRGLGELAEVLDPAYVDQDKATRLFVYRGDIAAEWQRYGPAAKPVAARFSAGVNAYIDWLAAHPERLPYEFRKVGYWPAKWSTDDAVRIRSHGLTRNLTSKVARAKVACKSTLAADSIRFGLQPPWQTHVPEGLDPCLPDDVLKVFTLATQNVRVTRDSLNSADASTAFVAAADNPEEVTEGGNHWLIAPDKSATGCAIMANDPRRAYAAPSLRYFPLLYTRAAVEQATEKRIHLVPGAQTQ